MNIKILLLILIFVVLYLLCIHTGTCTKDMVISRYNESLDWLYDIDEDKLCKMNIIVYNKNPLPFSHPKVNKIIDLPNV